jgi:creatinine amidohydrolase
MSEELGSRPSKYPQAQVRWAELLPRELRARRNACPIAWLPLGLCEPHGHIAAFGLDTIKADWLCDEGARRFGGVVAPTQGWHVHETGYHARWLEEVVGETPVELGSLPPDVFLRTFLYQLRAMANAGFRGVIAVSGHAGGNQIDLRRLASAFTAKAPLTVEVVADPELVAGKFNGDHAGRFEISQLLALRPELVDLSRLEPDAGLDRSRRFAVGDDAAEATAEHGWAILEAQLATLGEKVKRMQAVLPTAEEILVSLPLAEDIWAAFVNEPIPLVTAHPLSGQPPVSASSRWKTGEHWAGGALRDATQPDLEWPTRPR